MRTHAWGMNSCKDGAGAVTQACSAHLMLLPFLFHVTITPTLNCSLFV